ncbi:MAG TPA: hypothetical protein VHZ03_35815 [Trebonia sp.]|nr:hypothetical protein [Trebonia sp.]
MRSPGLSDPVTIPQCAPAVRPGIRRCSDLGSIPQSSDCSGTFEPEGVDYDTATSVLRVEITQPSVCEVATTVYEYQQG